MRQAKRLNRFSRAAVDHKNGVGVGVLIRNMAGDPGDTLVLLEQVGEAGRMDNWYEIESGRVPVSKLGAYAKLFTRMEKRLVEICPKS